MPEPESRPKIRPTHTINGETREWDGSAWVPIGTGAAALTAPRTPAAGRGTQSMPLTPEESTWRTELLKQGLTFAGGTAAALALPELALPAAAVRASPFVMPAARILASAFGGALGRMGGHVPEALTSAATGRPNSSTFAGDATIGAGEGAINEAAPIAFGPAMEALGTGLKGAGRLAFDNPEWNPWLRARVASMRGVGAGYVGGPVAGGVASVGPIAATEAGIRLKRAGAALPRQTLSEWAKGPLDALANRLNPSREFAPVMTAAERAERLSAAAEGAAQPRTRGEALPRSNNFDPVTFEGRPVTLPYEGPMAEPATLPSSPRDLRVYDRPRSGYQPPGPRTNPRSLTSEPPAEIPSGETPSPTTNPRGTDMPGRPEPLSGEAPPVTEGAPYNLEMGMFHSRDPVTGHWTLKPEGRTNPGAAVVDNMIETLRRATREPAGSTKVWAPLSSKELDAQLERMAQENAAKRAAAQAAAEAEPLAGPGVPPPPATAPPARVPAPEMPANLNADQLANYYETQYPPVAEEAGPVGTLKERLDAAGSFARKFGLPSTTDVATDVVTKNAKYAAEKAARAAATDAVDVGVSNDTLDALAKRLGLMKDKPF